MEEIVSNLNGYFQALRRLSFNKCDFWASILKIETTLDDAIETYLDDLKGIDLIEKSHINYREVENLYEEYIFSNLHGLDDAIIKLFSWDILEYYGLASTRIDAEGDFNPLVSNGAVLLQVKSEFHPVHIYYVVPYGRKAIITGLALRF